MKLKSIVLFIVLATCIVLSCGPGRREVTVLTAPAGTLFTQIDWDSQTVIPNGRFITPAGSSIQVAPHPYGLALSRDGQVAVTANSGTKPLSISIIRNVPGEQPEVQQVPPGPATDKGILASVFMG
ncbi:MAG: hypothetical protein P8Y60_07430, partial [Calditrichota bacterium]